MLLHAVEQGAERQHLGPAELVDCSRLARTLADVRYSCCDISHVHGLEACPSADERQDGGHLRHGGEAIEQTILGTEDQRGAQDDGLGKGLQHRGLTLGFGAPILPGRGRARTDGGDLDEAVGTDLAGHARDGAGARDMDGIKGLRAGLPEDADEVDHAIRALEGTCDRIGKADIALDGMDLTDTTHGLQMARQIRSAHDSANAKSAPRQRPDRMAADKARAPDDRDQPPFFPLHHPCRPIACPREQYMATPQVSRVWAAQPLILRWSGAKKSFSRHG